MLTDPFVIKAPTLSAHTATTLAETLSLARTQEQGGASVYGPSTTSTNHTVTMRVSHSVSNEFKPVKTKRVLLRLDVSGFTSPTQPAGAFAYVVIGMPETGLYQNAALDDDPLDAVSLVQLLIGALAQSNSASTLDETRIPRLVAGES